MSTQIVELFSALHEQMTLLSQQVVGLTAAHQIVLEVLLSQSPKQKEAVAQALAQVLAHPERVPNRFCLDVLNNIQEAARNPSRTSPEGRRGWMYLVSSPDSDEPPP